MPERKPWWGWTRRELEEARECAIPPKPATRGTPGVAALLAAVQRPSWQSQAACRGMDTALWFPERNDGDEARAICSRCPVAVPCRDEGMTERGIWGGMTERERRRYSKAA